MYAAAEGNREVVELLLEYEANPNLEDDDGEKAIDFSANNGHTYGYASQEQFNAMRFMN